MFTHVLVAFALTFGAAATTHEPQPTTQVQEQIVQHEQDAWASLDYREIERVITVDGEQFEIAYVDSGEHGTTLEGQISVWSISNEDLFHHFEYKSVQSR